MSTHVSEFLDIAKANTISVFVLFALTLIPSWYEYSRLVFLYFWLFNLVVLGFSRMIFREALRVCRRLGYNKRYVLVVGAGKLGEQIVSEFAAPSGVRIECSWIPDPQARKGGKSFAGCSGGRYVFATQRICLLGC